MATITSVNAVFMISIFPIFPAPQKLQGFMADDMYDVEAVDIAEIVLGVDGYTSAGFVPYNTKQTVAIMPDSISINVFETWILSEKLLQEKLKASAKITLPATNAEYTLTGGILTSVVAVPAAKRVLQGRHFVITWTDISKAMI